MGSPIERELRTQKRRWRRAENGILLIAIAQQAINVRITLE